MTLEQWLAKLRAAAQSPPSAEPIVAGAQRAAERVNTLTRGAARVAVKRTGSGARVSVVANSAAGQRLGARALRRALPDEMAQARAEITAELRGKLR